MFPQNSVYDESSQMDLSIQDPIKKSLGNRKNVVGDSKERSAKEGLKNYLHTQLSLMKQAFTVS